MGQNLICCHSGCPGCKKRFFFFILIKHMHSCQVFEFTWVSWDFALYLPRYNIFYMYLRQNLHFVLHNKFTWTATLYCVNEHRKKISLVLIFVTSCYCDVMSCFPAKKYVINWNKWIFFLEISKKKKKRERKNKNITIYFWKHYLIKLGKIYIILKADEIDIGFTMWTLPLNTFFVT